MWSIAPVMVYSMSGLRVTQIFFLPSLAGPHIYIRPPWMTSTNFSPQETWPVPRAAQICFNETIARVRGIISPLRLCSYQIMLVVFNVGISRSEPEDLG